MFPKNNKNQRRDSIYNIKDLFKCYSKKFANSQLLSEKLSSEISLIPELISFIGAENLTEKKVVLNEIGTLMEIKEYNKGHLFYKILSENVNNNFRMILKGNVMELGIKYIKKNLSFKEYFLYLAKIYLLKEKYLYMDCIKKNMEYFPLKNFKYYIENYNNKNMMNNFIENEKNNDNNNNIEDLKDIDIIKIGKEINMKDFDFIEELNKLKEEIKNSNWIKYKKKLNEFEADDKMINSFFELYNYNDILDDNIKEINSSKLKEVKYNVYIPYFFNKKILTPISFLFDLNYPFQIKNYTTFITLEQCFLVYIDKSKLNPSRLLFKFSHKQRLNYIYENIFSKHYLFKNININYLNNFGKYFQIINLNKDDTIFIQGELNKGVYIITKGNVQLITNQSYLDLIDLNYYLIHGIDYCSQYISDIKKKEIYTYRNHLNGYYEYNSKINNLMKNPIFTKNSKIKENINFGTYKIRDILGLGEMFNYKNNINLFTAKALNNNTEVVFIQREIFQALLSNDDINKKCGLLIEEKTRLLRECINKYKNFFENKINNLINKKNNNKNININKKGMGKSLSLKNNNSTINNLGIILNNITKIKHDFNIMKNNNEKSKIISCERNINSYKYKEKNDIKKNNDFFSLKKKLISMKLIKKISSKKDQMNKTLIGLKNIFPNLSQKSNYYDSNFNSENINNYLTILKKEKNENNVRYESARRPENNKIFKNRNIFSKKDYLSRSSNDIDKKTTVLNKRFIIYKFNEFSPSKLLGKNTSRIDFEK